MKLYLVFLVCGLALAAASPRITKVETFDLSFLGKTVDERSAVLNALIRQLLAFVRRVINNGWETYDIPPLDPLDFEYYHLVIPALLINLDLKLHNIHATGMGGFVVHKSDLNLHDLTFDLDISVPRIEIRASDYDLIGDLFGAFPLYGRGQARFVADNFRFQAKLHLKQSEDEKAILIQDITNVSFEIPSLKSELTGAIGGGDIDAIVNVMIEEVIMDYVNRFQGVIGQIAAFLVQSGLNPILEDLDTWKYIAPLLKNSV